MYARAPPPDTRDPLTSYESAIIATFSAASSPRPEGRLLHASALQFCESIEDSQGGLGLTMELLARTSRVEVEFYCLQAVQRALKKATSHQGGGGQDRAVTRDALMRWVDSLANKPPPPSYVWKKTGVVVALLIKLDFPNEWPNVFDDLCQSLVHGGKHAADLFLATLQALDEEIVSEGGPEAGRIKDAMRVLAVPKIVSSFAGLMATYQSLDPEIVRQTMYTCGLYVPWIDIGLVTSEPFLPLWFAACRDPRYRCAGTWLLQRALRKGMPYGAKIHLIRNLGLADAAIDLSETMLVSMGSGGGLGGDNRDVRLAFHPPPLTPSAWVTISSAVGPPPLSPGLSSTGTSIASSPPHAMVMSGGGAGGGDDFPTEVGRLCETLGVELLECRKAAVETRDEPALAAVEQLLERAVAAMLTCLSTSDLRAYRPALEFAILLDPKYCTGNLLHAALWCAKQTRRSSDHPPPPLLLSGEELEDVSRSTKRLFLQIAKKVPPQLTLTFLHKAAEYFFLPSSHTRAASDLEAVLFLIHAFGEGASDVVHRTAPKEDVDVFDHLLDLVFSSDVSLHSNYKVVLMHNELAARYVVALRAQPIEKVVHVLEALVGRGGVHHVHGKVRSRAVALLLRFVRALGPLPAFAQLVDPVLGMLRDVLRVDLEATAPVVAASTAATSSSAMLAVGGVGGGVGMGGRNRSGSRLAMTMEEHERDVDDVMVAGQQQHVQGGLAAAGALSLGDAMALFETVGLLLWSCEDQQKQLAYFSAVVDPLVGNVSRAVHAADGGGGGAWELHVTWAVASLEAFSNVTKCGSAAAAASSSSSSSATMVGTTPSPDAVPVRRWDVTVGYLRTKFQSCLDEVMALLALVCRRRDMASHDQRMYNRVALAYDGVMSSVKRLCFSMIQCLNVEFLPFVACVVDTLLVGGGDWVDISKPFQVLSTMMSTFRGNMAPQLGQVLVPMLRAANARIAPIANRPNPNQNDMIELIALEKELFLFLHSVVTYELSRTLLMPEIFPYLDELLRMMADGLASVPDASTQRTCCMTLQGLIKEWGDGVQPVSGTTGDFKDVFMRFVFERVTPASFQATAQPHFDPRDATCTALLMAICNLHRTCAERYGEAWLAYVSGVFLPSVNCPQSVAMEYVTAVVQGKTAKVLRGEFRRLFLGGGGEGGMSRMSSGD